MGRWLRLALPLALALGACEDEDFFGARVTGPSDGGADAQVLFPFGGSEGWAVNGGASPVNTTLRLTEDVREARGSGFLLTPQPLGPTTQLTIQFSFRVQSKATLAGDGVTLTFQNSPAGPQALGVAGSALGYDGIAPSVAVEFDTYRQPNETINANHVAVRYNGLSEHKEVATNLGFLMAKVAAVFVRVDYDARAPLLRVFLSQTPEQPAAPILSHAVALHEVVGPQAYVGFTAATGQVTSMQEILSFALSSSR